MSKRLTRRLRKKLGVKQKRHYIKTEPAILTKNYQNFLWGHYRLIKKKWSKSIYSIKKRLAKPTIILIQHYKIKEDFIQIYEGFLTELFDNPNLVSRTFPEREIWLNQAMFFSYQCITIDPHEKVTNFVSIIQELFKQFDEYSGKAMKYIFFIAIVLGSGSILSFFNYVSDKFFLISFIASGVFLIFGIYLYYLKTDTDFFHLINKDLRNSPKDILDISRKSRRKKSQLMITTFWNCALTDYNMISRLFLMVLLKMLTPTLYNRILFGLKEILPKHFEEIDVALKTNNRKKMLKIILDTTQETMKK